eukprot:6080104-Prymnesium_polylepis.3
MPPCLSLPGLLGALGALKFDDSDEFSNLFITQVSHILFVRGGGADAVGLCFRAWCSTSNDVFDVDTLLVMLRSPHNIAQIADLIDNSRELIDATAHTAHVSVQMSCHRRGDFESTRIELLLESSDSGDDHTARNHHDALKWLQIML